MLGGNKAKQWKASMWLSEPRTGQRLLMRLNTQGTPRIGPHGPRARISQPPTSKDSPPVKATTGPTDAVHCRPMPSRWVGETRTDHERNPTLHAPRECPGGINCTGPTRRACAPSAGKRGRDAMPTNRRISRSVPSQSDHHDIAISAHTNPTRSVSSIGRDIPSHPLPLGKG